MTWKIDFFVNVPSNSTVSINENSIISTVNIFPNPANDVINVNLNNLTKEVNIEMMSIDGKVVYQLNNVTNKNVTIDISNNSKGIYFLRIGSDIDYQVFKFINTHNINSSKIQLIKYFLMIIIF